LQSCSMKKINEEFVCINCGKRVPKAKKTCRNHCPYCFVSLHLDEKIPWDRASNCGGMMYPIEYEWSNGVVKITFKCSKCGHIHKNKAADDDDLVKLDELVKKYRYLF